MIIYSFKFQFLFEDSLDEGDTEDLKKIEGAGRQLLELINDILDLSKIEAQKLDLFYEDFELSELMTAIILIVDPLIDKNNNHLHFSIGDELGAVYADATRIKHCALNLLSNASKFTDYGDIFLDVNEKMDNDELIKEKYQGIRPAPGYPAGIQFTPCWASSSWSESSSPPSP